MEIQKSFKRKQSQIIMLIVVGFTSLICGWFIGMTFNIAVGIFIIIGALIIYNNPVIIKFFNEHLEIKVSPFAGVKLIRYADIKQIEKISKNKIFLHGKINGADSKLLLPMALLTESDQNNFMETLKTKMEEAKQPEPVK